MIKRSMLLTYSGNIVRQQDSDRFLLSLLVLANCDAPPPGTEGQRIYWIARSDKAAVQFRMLDSINALRRAKGIPEVAFSAELIAAAISPL